MEPLGCRKPGALLNRTELLWGPFWGVERWRVCTMSFLFSPYLHPLSTSPSPATSLPSLGKCLLLPLSLMAHRPGVFLSKLEPRGERRTPWHPVQQTLSFRAWSLMGPGDSIRGGPSETTLHSGESATVILPFRYHWGAFCVCILRIHVI